MAGLGIDRSMGELVELLPVPAFIADLSTETVVTGNKRAIEKYGVAVKKGAVLSVDGKLSSELSYLKPATDGEFGALIETVPDNAQFALYRVSKDLVILSDVQDTQSRSRLTIPPEGNHYPSYHFSYLHRMLSGERLFPDPAQLKNLSLIATLDDAENLDWRALVVEEDREAYDSVVNSAIEHGGNHRLRYRIKALDGTTHELTDFFSVIKQEGAWPVLSGTIVSTEGAEKTMQHVERLCLVGRLVGGMIHDFRNLLGGIQNMMEWCMTQSPEDSPVYDAMKKTISYTEQANGLIRSTLRLLDGKSDVVDEFIPVKPLLEDAKTMIDHFGGAAIKVRVDCSDMMPPLYGQRSVLLDILLNLGLNGCEAMEETGDTLIYSASLQKCRDHYGKTRQHVVIKVIDNGCGMTREQTDSIFNEFFTTKENGAGLGLWMVREGVHSFGGNINLETKLGIGTEFRVAIPVPELGAKRQPEKPVEKNKAITLEEIPFAKGKKVLFVEDDPLLRSGVETWLCSMGFEVLVAEDGTVGLDLFEANKSDIDLIIQDFVLPGVRGDVLLETFVTEAPDIPVIICSGQSEGSDEAKLLEKGASAFIAKAFRIETLISVIKDVLKAEPVEK